MKNISGQFKKSMSDRIKTIRLKLDLSKKDFAEKLGLSRNNISDIETHRQMPTIALINRIMKTLNISYNWLLTGEGDMYIKEKVELTQLEHFKKAFPDVPAEPDVIKLIEGMAVPVMKNALILKSHELKDFYRNQMDDYEKGKAQANK